MPTPVPSLGTPEIALKFASTLLFLLSPALRSQAPACPPPIGHIEFSSSTYSSQPGVTFRLRNFSAALVPQATTAPLCWQKFTVVSHAEIFVSNESLTKVFAGKLAQGDSKLSDFTVVNTVDGVTLSGKVKKLIPIAFSVSGVPTTDGTSILLHADKIKADGIPMKALLALIGENLSNVFGLKGVSGVSVQQDTLVFSPEQIARIKGHLESVQSTNEGVILRYSRVPAKKSRAAHAKADLVHAPAKP